MPALRCIEPAFLSVIKRQLRDLKALMTCEYCRKKTSTSEEEETDDLIYIGRNTREAAKSIYKKEVD